MTLLKSVLGRSISHYLYDQFESSFKDLQTLNVDTNSYGSLLVPLINEKLSTHIRVIIARKFKSEVWGLKKMIEVLKLEIEAKECSLLIYAQEFRSCPN